MTTTVYITIKTKPGHFRDLYEYARSDLYWTREYPGCHWVHCSSDEAGNTLKFCELWDSKEAFMQHFQDRGDRSGDELSQWVEEDGFTLEFYQTEDWGYGVDYVARGKKGGGTP